jgi:pyrrolidone-carboxylate peptidase
MKKRILVYGFGPYRTFSDNITARIVARLPRQAGLTKRVFSVGFSRRQFVDALMRSTPEIVLGLGQSSRRRIEIESRGINHRRADKSAPRKAIFPNESKQLRTTLKIKPGRAARISRNAGDYVCNYSIYILLREIKKRRLDTQFGFIHIPHHYDEAKAFRFVREVLQQCRKESRKSNIRRGRVRALERH